MAYQEQIYRLGFRMYGWASEQGVPIKDRSSLLMLTIVSLKHNSRIIKKTDPIHDRNWLEYVTLYSSFVNANH